jgi:hypothetical protein
VKVTDSKVIFNSFARCYFQLVNNEYIGKSLESQGLFYVVGKNIFEHKQGVDSMPFIAIDPETYEGKVVGNGQCVMFVIEAAGCPASSSWKQGTLVRGNDIPRGAAIATFIHKAYLNLDHGNHAAIYIEQNDEGIVVWDQWAGQPVHRRTIRFKGLTNLDRSNNGDWFSTVEV